jgi:uncharacterized protein (DUF2384 family)
MSRKIRRQENDSPLEAMRLEWTELNQDQFAVAVGIPRATYQRMVSGKTPLRLRPEEIVRVCEVCRINLNIFFERMGADITHLTMSSQRL